MRIGYPCVNYTIGCRCNRTFRLKSYSDRYLKDTVESNLSCLLQTLEYNVKHRLFFFRITSDLIPFASHPICTFPWQAHFRTTFLEIGAFIKKHQIRISMHPGQFTLINAEKESVFKRSLAELMYHIHVLESLGLDATSKIQIHIGGLYRNREASLRRFIRRYHQLDDCIRKHLVIENDDYGFSLRDCLRIHHKTGIPVIFDTFHHSINYHGETRIDSLNAVEKTWNTRIDGMMMIDYTSQQPDARKGTHATTLDTYDFKEFIQESRSFDFDLMLEIKDKECSAVKAVKILKTDPRFFPGPPAVTKRKIRKYASRSVQ